MEQDIDCLAVTKDTHASQSIYEIADAHVLHLARLMVQKGQLSVGMIEADGN